MRKALIASTFLASVASLAHAQSVQSGSIGGMDYYTMQTGTCSAAAPCSVVTYLGYQSESSGATANDLSTYFGGAFAQANPHTIVIAPIENGAQDATTNWGGYDSATTPEQAQMAAVVQGVEQQMGATVNPANSVVTGGSLGGTGTQAALVAYGPKGTVQPGLFSAGLSFDAADWSAAGNATQIAALCGVPLTAVHGTADTNQSISYDQNLASAINGNPACGNSFNLVPVQGAGHGTWAGSSGYQAGTGAGTPLGWVSDQLASGGTTAQTSAPAGGTQAAATAVQTASTGTQSATASAASISPGTGSLTDAQGHVWAITAEGRVTEDGQLVPGGGDTSALTLVNGTVWGQDNGNDASRANSGGWFTLGGDGATATWNASSTAPNVAAAATTTASAAAPAAAAPTVAAQPALSDYVGTCTAGVPNYAASTGGFGTVNGQIYGPDGQPWVARGIDVHDSDLMSSDGSAILSTFPGVNMIRVAVESYSDTPASFAAAVDKLTSQGVVVEFSDYTNSTGQNWGGSSGSVYTGAQLAAENAWYASMASYFAGNPYVWFGTDNEPATDGGSLSQWQAATYQAIRGAGNNNPILMEPSGSRPSNLQQALDPSVYATMTNVIWDPHVYGYQDNYATDQASNAANVQGMITAAQTIQSADGVVPVIIGEFGPATSGTGVDSNGQQMVQAVLDATTSGADSGATAWAYTTAPTDTLVDGSGNVTAFGQTIQQFVAGSGSSGCAQSPVPTTASSATTAPALGAASTDQTAPALAPASSSVTAPALSTPALTVDQVAAKAAAGP